MGLGASATARSASRELWDLDHGELVADFRLDAPVLAVALDDDGGAVAALDESGAVIRLNALVAGPTA